MILRFALAYDAMSKQKAPKAQADSLTWIEQSLREFGVAGLNVRELIEFCKVGLKSTNASVRTSATKTVTTIRLCLGSGEFSNPLTRACTDNRNRYHIVPRGS